MGRSLRRPLSLVAIAAGIGALFAVWPGDRAGAYALDPQSTNTPYLAWRGETVRLTHCHPDLARAKSAEVSVETWSGAPESRPQVTSQPADVFVGGLGVPCVAADAVTSGDGLAEIKLVAADATRAPVATRRFLALWMSLNAPSLARVSGSDPTAGRPGSAAEVGDPAGDGVFQASSRNGRVRVTVTGSFPHPLGPGGRFELPSAWPALAVALARDADANPANDAATWDHHDDQSLATGHVPGGVCGEPPSPVDAVDNCVGGGAGGPFSRVLGDATSNAFGPLDLTRGASRLPDGKLDASDAPMPAARVDMEIAAHRGGSDIGGAGALLTAAKTVVYSRDGDGGPDPGNLYAPYYSQFIAATASGFREASGVTAAAPGGNGFLVSGRYDNWRTLALAEAVARDSGCRRTLARPGSGSAEVRRQTPAGPQTVALYTDEHGEAQVEFEPYANGFHFEALGAHGTAQGGCDLQDVRTLGEAQLSATARYPVAPLTVGDAPKPSGRRLAMTVANLVDTSVSYWPKGTGSQNDNARILIAHANDVDASPLPGQRVCFYIDEAADGARVFHGPTGPSSAPLRVDGERATDAERATGADVCAALDARGNAAVEVIDADPEAVAVVADFVDQGVLRDISVDFGLSNSSGGAPPGTRPQATDGSGSPGSGEGAQPPLREQVYFTAGPQRAPALLAPSSGETPRKRPRSRVAAARLIRHGGRRELQVQVSSSRARATISVRLLGARGETIRRVVRAVRTNRLVTVRLTVPPKATKVKVAVVG